MALYKICLYLNKRHILTPTGVQHCNSIWLNYKLRRSTDYGVDPSANFRVILMPTPQGRRPLSQASSEYGLRPNSMRQVNPQECLYIHSLQDVIHILMEYSCFANQRTHLECSLWRFDSHLLSGSFSWHLHKVIFNGFCSPCFPLLEITAILGRFTDKRSRKIWEA